MNPSSLIPNTIAADANYKAMMHLIPLLPAPDPNSPVNGGIPGYLNQAMNCRLNHRQFGDEAPSVEITTLDLTAIINGRRQYVSEKTGAALPPVAIQQVDLALTAGLQEALLAKQQTVAASYAR